MPLPGRIKIVVGAMAVSSALLLSAPVLADHEPGTQTGPVVTTPQRARDTWPNTFYYLLDFSLGDAENPMTDSDFGVDLDWSAGIGFGVGYRLGPLRLEGGFHHEFFRVGSLDVGPTAPFPVDTYAGGMTADSAMARLYVDLPAAGSMRPYLGAGYGLARVDAEYNESVCVVACFSTKNEIVNDWDMVEAWQAMAGLSFGGSTFTEWFIGYRYFETGDLNFKTIDGDVFRQDGLETHTLSVGFRFLI